MYAFLGNRDPCARLSLEPEEHAIHVLVCHASEPNPCGVALHAPTPVKTDNTSYMLFNSVPTFDLLFLRSAIL